MLNDNQKFDYRIFNCSHSREHSNRLSLMSCLIAASAVITQKCFRKHGISLFINH